MPIDITQQKTSVTIPIKLILPAGIEVADISVNPMLELGISAQKTTTFTYKSTSLTTSGLGAGLTVDLPTQSILLTVQSSADASSGLVAGDFALSLNLNGLGAGTHLVPILVETLQKGLTLSTTPKEIQVIIH
jgi:YbbR domain-containing protein